MLLQPGIIQTTLSRPPLQSIYPISFHVTHCCHLPLSSHQINFIQLPCPLRPPEEEKWWSTSCQAWKQSSYKTLIFCFWNTARNLSLHRQGKEHWLTNLMASTDMLSEESCCSYKAIARDFVWTCNHIFLQQPREWTFSADCIWRLREEL